MLPETMLLQSLVMANYFPKYSNKSPIYCTDGFSKENYYNNYSATDEETTEVVHSTHLLNT